MSAVETSADKYFLVCHGKTIQCESKQFSLSCASHAEESFSCKKFSHAFCRIYVWLPCSCALTQNHLSPQLRNIIRVILNLKSNTTAGNSGFLKLIFRYRCMSETVSYTRMETVPV